MKHEESIVMVLRWSALSGMTEGAFSWLSTQIMEVLPQSGPHVHSDFCSSYTQCRKLWILIVPVCHCSHARFGFPSCLTKGVDLHVLDMPSYLDPAELHIHPPCLFCP